MTIYYFDGNLSKIDINEIPKPLHIIDARDGYRYCKAMAESLFAEEPECYVLTNQITLFDSLYCWNEKLQRPELYLWCDMHKRWEHITERYANIRITNNLMKMYIADMYAEDD